MSVRQDVAMNISKKVAALAVAGGLLLGGGAAVAYASSTTDSSPVVNVQTPTTTAPSNTTTTTAPAPSGQRHGRDKVRRGLKARRILRNAVHADVIVKDDNGQYVTVTYDRGSVTEATATSIKLHRADGHDVTITVNADTKVRGAANAAAVKLGAEAVVVSRGGTATRILQKRS
jgi:hypothetical protein